MNKKIKVLVIGDTVGRPGRRICQKFIPELREEESLDFVVVNGENIAGGSGITESTAKEILEHQADVMTSGDHIFKSKTTDDFFHHEKRVLRPLNYPKGSPGFGSGLFQLSSGLKIGVVNIIGRVFLVDVDNPFTRVREEIETLRKDTPIILVDFHAEATSEKIAMGWYLDGTISLLYGTHTHVQTADERILPKGTAYLTDVGMTGSYESVLGREIKPVLERFLTDKPTRFGVAKGDVRLLGAIVEIDTQTGKATSIKRIERKMSDEN